ncbi:MAG: SGNH/GDSL hydrolase family protein [Deltaproteobacteria bacterium]
MKKEWVLSLGVTVLTALVGLGLIWLFAPQLIGSDRDLQLVQVGKEVPPFFDNVFRKQDYDSLEFIIQDPYVKRAKPLYKEYFEKGPHDILGFRNRAIPNIADIITIGDSQTYGNNAVLMGNWPSQMQATLRKWRPIVYNMSVGGWGAAEYLEIFSKALLFQPEVIVVAFYSGNDPLETFQQAYGNKHYALLKMDQTLKSSDIPRVVTPAPKTECWQVQFKDGVSTIFTPKLRHSSNQQHPAVKAGYAGMAEAGRMMGEMAHNKHVKLVFTIIPTKELVYAKKVERDGITPTADYQQLVADEHDNIRWLADKLKKVTEAIYVDVVIPLQEASKYATPLYSENINGHPQEKGYRIIAHTLAVGVQTLLSTALEGLVVFRQSEKQDQIVLVRDGKTWFVPSVDMLRRNGWSLQNIPLTDERKIRQLPRGGVMDRVDAARFGPR